MRKKLVIIIGFGGHAKVLIDILKKNLFKIIGFVEKKNIKSFNNYKFLGRDKKIFDYSPNKVFLINGIGYIGKDKLRKKIFERFKKKKYNFLSLKHSKSIIANNVKCLEGSQIMAGSVLQSGCVIGKNSIINTSVSIDHDCQIGDNVHISPGTTICGNVKIGNNTFIGAGSLIIPNINIPSNSFIKAGEKILKTYKKK